MNKAADTAYVAFTWMIRMVEFHPQNQNIEPQLLAIGKYSLVGSLG